MDLIEHEASESMSREQAAQKLRDIADQLARHNQLEFEREGIKYSVKVPDQVTFGLEVEVGDDGSEIEVEISC